MKNLMPILIFISILIIGIIIVFLVKQKQNFSYMPKNRFSIVYPCGNKKVCSYDRGYNCLIPN